ncbi:MAG: hypothetical protein OEQ53_14295 [Saprospiraceae bacterium]|nr:hypothetical protein [Saprospiraceae bacterium]
MYPYKVVFVENTFLKKTVGQIRKGNVDGMTTSKELEALLVEKHEEGFELKDISPVNGLVVSSPYSINTTLGFMVTFKKVRP